MESDYLENSFIGHLNIQDCNCLKPVSPNDSQLIFTLQTSSPLNKYFKSIDLIPDESIESSPRCTSYIFPSDENSYSQKTVPSPNNFSKWETGIDTGNSEWSFINTYSKSNKKIPYINEYGDPNSMLTKSFPFVKKGNFIKKISKTGQELSTLPQDN